MCLTSRTHISCFNNGLADLEVTKAWLLTYALTVVMTRTIVGFLEDNNHIPRGVSGGKHEILGTGVVFDAE